MMGSGHPAVSWPNGKKFAFTVFDDTDKSEIENVSAVYDLLRDLGFRTTKSVWPSRGVDLTSPDATGVGATCEDRDYLEWVLKLQHSGFEIGSHLNTFHTSTREETLAGLNRFKNFFGHDPLVIANHGANRESIYWGAARLSGVNRFFYHALNPFAERNLFRGNIEGDPLFWGDLCESRIKYVRNFVFKDINTLRACPSMPYHDPSKPYVKEWFASSNGANVHSFTQCIGDAEQDRLEAESGLCIMYTHFAYGFYDSDQGISQAFKTQIEKLSRRDGWFAPVSTILDYLKEQRGPQTLSASQRRKLELAWLMDRVMHGSGL